MTSDLSESTTATTAPAGSTTAGVRAAARHPGLVAIFPRSLETAPTTWHVSKPAILGRSREAEIQVGDPAVSRRQAQLEQTTNGLRISDFGSQHGTFVDGKPVPVEGCIAPYGAVLRAGSTLFLLAEDVTEHAMPMRKIAASFLGTHSDVIAGPALCKVWQQAAHVATLSQPALILGESGSGKEAVARLLHAMRKEPGPFVALNLAAIPEALFESELFGHVRGAFTGAVASRAGAFLQATGGVLFIDEVADLHPNLQVKLLRAIDQMCVRPVGSDRDVAVTTRVVAATSQDLKLAAEEGRFRADLYYRLAGIVLELPPLRERRADILALSLAYLQHEHPGLSLNVRAAESLTLARWRGNVRELHHALTRGAVEAIASGNTEILVAHLPELELFNTGADELLTSDAVRAAIATANGNASVAAKALGVSRSTLYNVLKRDGVDPSSLRIGK